MKVPDAACRTYPFRVTFSAAVAVFLLSSHSEASEWRIRPRLNLIETYSDNVRLGAAGSSDDFITQINPGIIARGVASRYNIDVNYMMNNLIYANNNDFNRI